MWISKRHLKALIREQVAEALLLERWTDNIFKAKVNDKIIYDGLLYTIENKECVGVFNYVFSLQVGDQTRSLTLNTREITPRVEFL